MTEQKVKLFDRFAEASAGFVSRAPFFVADGLADFMEHLGGDQPGFAKDIDDLRRAVGVEKEMVNKHA
jgi:hypothetical protein